MNLTIHPRPLSGTLRVPSSKSMTHREIIAAALAEGVSEVTGVNWSQDIELSLIHNSAPTRLLSISYALFS